MNLSQLTEGLDYIKYEWPHESIKRLHIYNTDTYTSHIPDVSIQEDIGVGSWQILETTHYLLNSNLTIKEKHTDLASHHLITYLDVSETKKMKYVSIFIFPKGFQHTHPIRFAFTNKKGQKYYSESFN